MECSAEKSCEHLATVTLTCGDHGYVEASNTEAIDELLELHDEWQDADCKSGGCAIGGFGPSGP